MRRNLRSKVKKERLSCHTKGVFDCLCSGTKIDQKENNNTIIPLYVEFKNCLLCLQIWATVAK